MTEIAQAVIIGAALSMDAFAVSVADSLALGKAGKRWFIPAAFGVFQAIMPLIGYGIGSVFAEVVTQFGRYVAFGLLLFVGGKMLIETIKPLISPQKPETAKPATELTYPAITVQAIATSIDALMVGVSFRALGSGFADVVADCGLIGLTTLIICSAGIIIGGGLGKVLAGKAGILGGVVLIALGIKFLIGA